MKITPVIVAVAALAATLAPTTAAAAPVALGPFTFNGFQFGNTLVESDGGAHSGTDWMNVVNANPGNPALLTGANFDTGIHDINGQTYTIGYTTPIVNVSGADVGVVVARFSFAAFDISFSTDGTTFGAPQTIPASTGVYTFVNQQYFVGGVGPSFGELNVHSLDLGTFGVAPNASIFAARVTSNDRLDLIRVAGFEPVPEPATMAALGLGTLALLRRRCAAR